MTASNLRARSAYRTAMESAAQKPFSPLTLTSLKSVTPHLTDDQRRFLIANRKEWVHIATPGLEVANSYFTVVLHLIDQPTFTVVRAKRCSVCDPAREAMFAQEALDFARENWGAELGSESDGKYHRMIVPDDTLVASGLPVRPLDLTVVHFVSTADVPETTPEGASLLQLLDAHIVRIFDGEIECIEHRGARRFRNPNPVPTWEVTEMPAKVLAHLRGQAARQAA
jgi:hypothetical protein